MIRAGLVCGSCSGRCVNAPTRNEPLMIACPCCDEYGCEDCSWQGYYYIDTCPKQTIDLPLYYAAKLANYFEKGMLPVAGGTLNQAAWFLDFANLLKYETDLAESARNRGR